MNPIAQITANKKFCEELIALGIHPRAFFYHVSEPNEKNPEEPIWDVWELERGSDIYKPGEIIPAWTKEELDVMIGGDVPVPRLPQTHEMRVITVDKKAAYQYEYVFYDLEAGKSWIKTGVHYNPGARASAEVMIIALNKGWITANEANTRYNVFFKP